MKRLAKLSTPLQNFTGLQKRKRGISVNTHWWQNFKDARWMDEHVGWMEEGSGGFLMTRVIVNPAE